MPETSPAALAQLIKRRLAWAVRDAFPRRRVVRVVQGVEMTLPWSHRLPDYAADGSPYGQNLVELARLLGAAADEPLVVVDVGANVGDSTLQILDATDARVVCVEADEFYLDFLQTNVGDDERCAVEAALLVPDASAPTNVSPVRKGGTTRFVEDEPAGPVDQVTPAALRKRHPWTERLRLVKSDTDGYDVALVPALATQWRDLAPVLFFEYDLRLSRIAGNDPLAVWDKLAALGYAEVAVWGHGGDALFRAPIGQLAEASARLEEPEATKLRAYWDVAVVHGDDEAGLAAIAQLVPRTL